MMTQIFSSLPVFLFLLSLGGNVMANPTEEVGLSGHPSALRTQMQQHVASVVAKVSTLGQQNVQYWKKTVGLAPRRTRHLAENNTCVPEVLYADDNSTLVTFGPQFEPLCTCDEEEPDISGYLDTYTGSLNQLEINEFLVDFTNFMNGSVISEEESCLNQCAMCFAGYCAYKETLISTTFTLGLSRPFFFTDVIEYFDNSTTPEEQDEFITDLLLLDDLVYTDRDCYNFVEGPEMGLVCISFVVSFTPDGPIPAANLTDDDFDPSTQAFPTCVGSVDGVECTSCELTIGPDGGCVNLDCTNVLANSMPDSCADDPASTFTGIFEAMYIFDVEDDAFAQYVVAGNVTPECSPIFTVAPSRAVVPFGWWVSTISLVLTAAAVAWM